MDRQSWVIVIGLVFICALALVTAFLRERERRESAEDDRIALQQAVHDQINEILRECWIDDVYEED
jgi:flagellar basal body-associated protein FliL